MCRCLKREIQSKFLQTSILPLKFKVNFITFDAIFHEIWLHIPNNSNTCQISSLLETPILKASVERNFEFLQTRLTCVSVGIIHQCLLKILCKCDRQIWSYHWIFLIGHLAKFSTIRFNTILYDSIQAIYVPKIRLRHSRYSFWSAKHSQLNSTKTK